MTAETREKSDVARLPLAAATWSAGMVDFARRLIQTPSPSGDEAAVASLTLDEMQRLGYDDAWIDPAGNVVGVYRGRGAGPTVQFNAHLDHVDPGDQSLWPRPPFAAEIADDVLYGRGASDVKGAMASQVYLVPVLKEAGLRPDGDVFVVGVVLEEVGGFGSQYLARTMPTDSAILAEATNNQLCRGHRGRVSIKVTFTGLSAHASAPERGRNPHFAAARFLLALEALAMQTDPTFGQSSASPTLIATDQSSGNVIPATITVSIDWRTVPTESETDILAKLQPLIEAAAAGVTGVQGRVELGNRPVRSYTGLSESMPSTRGFVTAADDPLVKTAHQTLTRTLGRPVEIGTWGFATDGGHLAHHGIKTIGFAAGEERFAHTIHDQIDLTKLRESLVGNAALALAATMTESAQ